MAQENPSENKKKPTRATGLFSGTAVRKGWRENIFRLSGTPHSVALGVAIGVFVGLTPTIPLHTVLVLSLSFLFRASKGAALTASFVANPATIPFIYYLSFKLGDIIWDLPITWHPGQLSLKEMVGFGWEFALEMITGGLMLAVFPSALSYWIVKRAIELYRKKHLFGMT